MCQLKNSKRFVWLTAASLQATFVLGGAVFVPSVVAQSKVTTPLTKTDLATYSTMSLLAFCQARDLDVGFENSLRIALAAEVITVFQKHGGKAEGLKDPLDEKQFAAGAEFRLVGRAIEACPKLVPAEQKSRFEKVAEKIKKRLNNN